MRAKKAPALMVLTDSGIAMDPRLEQPTNEKASVSAIELGSLTDSKLEQISNADAPRNDTPSEIAIFLCLAQFVNAPPHILLRPAWSSTSFRLASLENAKSPIASTPPSTATIWI